MKDRLLKFAQGLAKRKFQVGIIVVLLMGGAYFGYQTVKGSDIVPKYTMTAVTKGTLITTVSGTGQVAVSSQIDIKPKVSGQVTSLKIANGQSVKAGQVIATIDSKQAQKSVRDAEIGLEDAQISLKKLQEAADQYSVAQAKSSLQDAQIALQKLQEPPTAYDLTVAQNAVTQAQRDLDKAKDDSTKLGLDTDQALQKAYDDAMKAISSAYIDIPNLIKDDNGVQNDNSKSGSQGDYLNSYKIILGEDSDFITTYVNDYDDTDQLYKTYSDNYNLNGNTTDRVAQYKLLKDTLDLTKSVYESLASARNMLDAMVDRNYKSFDIAPTIDKFRTLIGTDLTTANNDITELQNAIDTIDTTTEDNPFDVKNAAAAVSSAEENLTEKQNALAKLKAGADVNDIASAQQKVSDQQLALNKLLSGADELDIQSQQLSVQQKQNTLNDAREALADYSVTAPFDCLISKVNVVQGDDASSGTSLATVISTDVLADVSLNEVDVAKIKVGDKATLTFDAIDGLSISGKVAEIDLVGTVTQGVVTYNVKISFDTSDSRIKPGMSVSAAIINQVDQDVLMLSSSAIKTSGTVSYVETLPANLLSNASGGGTVSTKVVPTQVPVQIGIANDTDTEITGGDLKEGDQVILKTVTTPTTTTAAAGGASALRLGGGGFAGGALGGGGFTGGAARGGAAAGR